MLLKREDLVRIFEQDGYDCVLPHKVNLGLQTVEEQYAEKHDIKELYAAGESIKKLYPCYYKYYEEVLKERYAYERNIFFMKKDMFDRYAEFIFTIIGDLEKNYGFQTSRVYAYLGERLINVFLKAEKPKIMELNYVHMEMQLGLWYLKVVFNRILNKIICR